MRQLLSPAVIFVAVALNFQVNYAMAEPIEVCSIFQCQEIDIDLDSVNPAAGFAPAQISEVVGVIAEYSGVTPNFTVLADRQVANAVAATRGARQFIIYNPEFLESLERQEKWNVTAVLAHEIGHHLHGHNLDGLGSRPHKELEADVYSGFVMAALGSSLREAQFNWLNSNSQGSFTHPPARQRRDAIAQGWNSFHEKFGNRPASNSNRREDATENNTERRASQMPDFNRANCVNVRYSAASVRATMCVTSYHRHQDRVWGARALATIDDQTKPWLATRLPAKALIEFERPVSISGVNIQNGDQLNINQYDSVGRVKRMKLKFSNGSGVLLRLENNPAIRENYEVFSFEEEQLDVSWMVFEIEDTYEGQRHRDKTALGYLSPIFAD